MDVQPEGSMRAVIHLLNVVTCHPDKLPEPVATSPRNPGPDARRHEGCGGNIVLVTVLRF
ncbi:hypothetical protein [Nonomuraea sp. NPDC049480]|uniref:hypothetical protein n=1 Tax=Nonomuraea sp. NPDC049480 TaxID=3364353 RepID=UPI0037A07857